VSWQIRGREIISIFKTPEVQATEGGAMTLRRGDRWICVNSECRAEIVVVTASKLTGGCNPHCSCGNLLKKPYEAPNLTRVSSEKAAVLSGEQFNQTLLIGRPRGTAIEEVS
jgi:hypothetical protein